jgi:glycosyltransferase involved in cell wall biosynthesis
MGNKFVFVACSYNMSHTLARMLHSIVGQSYENWRLLIVDDVSDEDHIKRSLKIVQSFHSILGATDRHKLSFCLNDVKKWEVENVLTMIRGCDDDDIVCRIDADDWLIDLDALAIINEAYESTKCEALWTAHRWGFSDYNISGPMNSTADPYVHPWVSSHLKTFKKRLLNNVVDVNFRGEDGNYVRRAGDQAIYLPALYNTPKRVFLPRVMYHYSIDEQGGKVYQTDDARFQKSEADFIRMRGYVAR